MTTAKSAKSNQTSLYVMPNQTIKYDETVFVQRNEQINTLPPNYSQAVNTVAGVNNYPPQTINPNINEEYKRQQKFSCCIVITYLVIVCSGIIGAIAWFIYVGVNFNKKPKFHED